jgi:DHA1 family bicyclomycin/chloramphenicol resistance-like MFS transporter
VVLIGALSAFGPLSLDMYLPGLPDLARDLQSAEWQAQLTLTACLVGLACGQLIAGPLSDALGRRRPLLVGLLGYGLASLLCALAPSPGLLIAARLVQGLSGAAGIVIARAVVRDMFTGADVARFFALTMAINGLAPILAPIVGGAILPFVGWRGVFVVLAAIGLALLAAAGLGLHETLPAERRRAGGLRVMLSAFGTLLGDRAFMGYGLSSGLAFAAMFIYIASSPFVLQQLYGLSPQAFSMVFASNALGIVAVSQVSGRLVGRVGAHRLMAWGIGSSAVGGLLLVGALVANLGLAGIIAGLFVVVASVGLIAPNASALALANHPTIAGSASAFVGVLQFLVGAVAIPLVGAGGMASAMPMAAGMALLSLAACATFALLTRHHTE